MYDYYLGGKDNFAADRDAAELALQLAPELRDIAREARLFLRRAVRLLIEAGVRQFVDVGSGLPTQGGVHEIADEAAPGCAVVYVDNDPVVRSHAQALITDRPAAAFVQADMRDAGQITGHPEFRRLIDLDRPVGLLFSAVLYTIPDDAEAAEVVRALGAHLGPGSHLVISHPVCDMCPELTARLAYLYQEKTKVISGTPRPNVRTRADVARFFDGWEIIPPGLAYLSEWHGGTPATAVDSRWDWAVGGIARR